MRALGGAETRHSHGYDVLPVYAHTVEGLAANQQRERTVQSARHSYHALVALDVLEACLQAGYLNVKDFAALLFNRSRAAREKRVSFDVSEKK